MTASRDSLDPIPMRHLTYSSDRTETRLWPGDEDSAPGQSGDLGQALPTVRQPPW
jgi:hypothetical protein